MINNDNKKILKIWCTYHNENILKEYDLYNTKNIQLFNDDDLTLKEDNINYLHDYLGDMTTYYYIWKNQIKSDYVGFCQYKRHFKYINYDDLYKNGIISYMNCMINIYESQKICINDCIFMDFINFIYYKYNIDIYDYIFKKPNKIAFHSMFIFRWDIFNEICEFMFGFLDYLTLNKWKNENNINHLIQYYHLININDYTKENPFAINWLFKRAWSIVNEIFLGIFVNIKYNINFDNYEKYYIYLDEENINNIDNFDKWYKINIKTGITYFYVNKYIYNILNNDNKLNIHQYNYIYNKIPNNLIEIKLKLNQRILCEDSLEFHKGNYQIAEF